MNHDEGDAGRVRRQTEGLEAQGERVIGSFVREGGGVVVLIVCRACGLARSPDHQCPYCLLRDYEKRWGDLRLALEQARGGLSAATSIRRRPVTASVGRASRKCEGTVSIYEETDSRLVQLEKLRAHVLRVMRGWRPENFSSPELYQQRVEFGERGVRNLERAIEREIQGAQNTSA